MKVDRPLNKETEPNQTKPKQTKPNHLLSFFFVHFLFRFVKMLNNSWKIYLYLLQTLELLKGSYFNDPFGWYQEQKDVRNCSAGLG